MYRYRILLLTLIVLALLPASAAATNAEPCNPPCTAVNGEFTFTRFEFTSETTAVGEGVVTWTQCGASVTGAFVADYFNIEARGNGVTQLNGQHTITLPDGVVQTFDEILLQEVRNSSLATETDPTVLRANSRLYIIDGAGAYANASGMLQTYGAFNATSLEGSIGFRGRICIPQQ